MARLRFLRSVAIPRLNEVMNFNDELEVSDEELVKDLVKKGLVDVLNEQKNPEKPLKRAPKRAPEEPKLDV